MSTDPAPMKPPVENRPPGDTRASYLEIPLLERLKKNRDFCWRLELAADHLGGGQADERARVTFAAVAELAKRLDWQLPEEFAGLACADFLTQAVPILAVESTSSPASNSVVGAEVAVSRRGLTTPEAAVVFSRLTVGGWDTAGWVSAFQDPSAWLKKCRVSLGVKGNGGKPSTWCPMQIARALVEGAGRQEPVPLKIMHARFQNRSELAPWRDEWTQYFLSCNNLAS